MRTEIVSAYSKASTYVPQGSRVVLFGSSVNSDSPSDIDIIIIYNKQMVSAKDAFTVHDKFINEMASLIPQRIHVMMLDEKEYYEINIKDTEEVLELTA